MIRTVEKARTIAQATIDPSTPSDRFDACLLDAFGVLNVGEQVMPDIVTSRQSLARRVWGAKELRHRASASGQAMRDKSRLDR